MSIGSLGIVGGLAGTPLSQRAAETDRAERETTEQTRRTQADDRAEQSAGIGQTEEDSGASDRDADGRRPWELPASTSKVKSPVTAADDAADLSGRPKDPRGETGTRLDLLG